MKSVLYVSTKLKDVVQVSTCYMKSQARGQSNKQTNKQTNKQHKKLGKCYFLSRHLNHNRESSYAEGACQSALQLGATRESGSLSHLSLRSGTKVTRLYFLQAGKIIYHSTLIAWSCCVILLQELSCLPCCLK